MWFAKECLVNRKGVSGVHNNSELKAKDWYKKYNSFSVDSKETANETANDPKSFEKKADKSFRSRYSCQAKGDSIWKKLR
ncbi:MAG: hypothetical protein CVV03_01485 [Firmicutes bacterium HGW-Firmicutes-8]|nr:MAG: hypothetical protein CVV03_01485 [Firmicutes bacterium HGW-Firmicutes-8]